MWLGGWDTLTLNHKGYSKSVRATELNNKNIYVLQIGAVLFYCKLGQMLLQIETDSILQIRANVVTNWGSYYILG